MVSMDGLNQSGNCVRIRQFLTSVERFANDLVWLFSHPHFTAAAMHLDAPNTPTNQTAGERAE